MLLETTGCEADILTVVIRTEEEWPGGVRGVETEVEDKWIDDAEIVCFLCEEL
jgi:hypothetical protein